LTEQSYATHRRFLPAYHFFALPVFIINVVFAVMHFVGDPRVQTGWSVVVAVALVALAWVARSMPLRAQDRLIRFEERTRFERLLPTDLRGKIDQLSPSQFIALRFAPDDEVPELTRRALNGELRTGADIKRAITNWRADHLRV
jgi:hypothetical protein